MQFDIPGLNIQIKVRRKLHASSQIEKRDYNKVFVIGFNKTGTTSLKKVLEIFGFKVGNQAVAEILSEDWAIGKIDRIVRYCHTADAFQDTPFSKPGLFKELDKAFPGSKFILTVRDNSEQWFKSMVRFHSKKFSSQEGLPPTEADLTNATYRYKGFMLESFKNYWNFPNVPLYHERIYKEVYEKHIEDVKNYFKERSNDLIIVNVAQPEDFKRLCQFLNVSTNLQDFPWENKT